MKTLKCECVIGVFKPASINSAIYVFHNSNCWTFDSHIDGVCNIFFFQLTRKCVEGPNVVSPSAYMLCLEPSLFWPLLCTLFLVKNWMEVYWCRIFVCLFENKIVRIDPCYLFYTNWFIWDLCLSWHDISYFKPLIRNHRVICAYVTLEQVII